MRGLTRLVIGSAVGGLIGGAAFLGVEAAMPHKASAELYTTREASVFIKNDELARKLGTHFLDECEASQRSATSEVKVTCYGSF